MQIEKIIAVDDCFDGTMIKEITFSSVITKEMIFILGKDGNIQYFPDFARPFFKIRKRGIYDLKGIEGNKTMRVHIKQPEIYNIDDFIDLVNSI